MNETLEAMARALFKSWFVDFDPVRAKAEGRDPGLPKPIADLFPARLVNSELGEIPEGWDCNAMDDLARFVMASRCRSIRPPDGKSRAGYQNRAASHPAVPLAPTEPALISDPDYIVQDGDILFSWSGSTANACCGRRATGRTATNISSK